MNKIADAYHTILLVEDDKKLSSLIVRYLQKNNLNVETEFRGDKAVKHILDIQPDLVILDVMLPGMDGFEVCKQVRPDFEGSILMLTAKDEDIDQIVGLEIGADDYVLKPTEPRLLLARIRALLRRSIKNPPQRDTHEIVEKSKLEFGSLIINKSARRVLRNRIDIELTSTEFNLLWFLASQEGSVLSREQICECIFNVEYDGLNRSVDNKISRLRKLLQDNTEKPKGIKTIRGKGYLFVADGW